MHSCEACVVTCIDFRFQDFIQEWTKKNLPSRSHDRVAFAGGVKDLETIIGQVNTSYRLHNIEKVVLINHEDCGAYGELGTPQRHAEDLRNAADRIQELHPNLMIESYYLHLDGTFEKV